MRRFTPSRTMLDVKAATGWGTAMSIADFRHKKITIVVSGQGAEDVATVKFATSNLDTVPTFSSASTATNYWDYDRVRNKNSGSLVTADTGFTFSNSNTTEQFIMEDDSSKWVSVQVSTYTDANASGLISAFLSCSNDAE